MKKKVITFGEVMLRLSSPGYAKVVQSENFNATYGGGEANVAISLAHFGLKSAHVTRFPDNDLGKSASNLLRRYDVATDHIVYGGERMGIYFLETGAGSRSSKIIYDRNYSSFSSLEPEMIDWEQVFEGASWFHWTGITPGISLGAAKACKQGIEIANRKGLTVSSDINYRKNLWQYGKSVQEIMPELISGCDVIIASKHDAQDILTIKVDEESSETDIYDQIMKMFPRIKKIASTTRKSITASHNKLSGTLYNGKNLIKSRKYDIMSIVDRIGGGDAFMAGLIYGLMEFQDDEKALEFGVSASVLKHFIEGDANLIGVEDVESLMYGDGSGRLIR